MNKQELLKQDLVYGIGQNLNNKKNITNSLLVAEKFQKQHKHVLEDIKKILEDGRNLGNPFYCKKKEYINDQNKKQPYYEMDKDFFTLLVMGYNNKTALEFKIKYIQKFNQMEQELLQRRETRRIGKTIRFNYTDFIKFVNGNEISEFINWSYKIYTDLVYKIVFNGTTAKQKRLELRLKPNQNLRDYLTNEENQQVQFWEKFIRDLCISNNWHKLDSKECLKKVKAYLREKNILKDLQLDN